MCARSSARERLPLLPMRCQSNAQRWDPTAHIAVEVPHRLPVQPPANHDGRARAATLAANVCAQDGRWWSLCVTPAASNAGRRAALQLSKAAYHQVRPRAAVQRREEARLGFRTAQRAHRVDPAVTRAPRSPRTECCVDSRGPLQRSSTSIVGSCSWAPGS